MGSRILVVDSDFGIRVRVVAALVSAGYEPSVAGDSWDAMSVAARERPDLILLGDSIARTSLSLLGRLITSPATADVPVLVVADGVADRRAADRAGARAVIPGPIPADDLVREIRKHVGVRGPLLRAPDSVLSDEQRLAAVNALRPEGTEQATLDRFTALASQMLGVPISTIALIERDRQLWVSQVGLSEPWATAKESPLDYSYCQFTITARQPLAIDDAHLNPLTKDMKALSEQDVVAYLGIPIITDDDLAVGSLCAIDHRPRAWTEHDVQILQGLADILTEHFNTVRRRGRHATV